MAGTGGTDTGFTYADGTEAYIGDTVILTLPNGQTQKLILLSVDGSGNATLGTLPVTLPTVSQLLKAP